MNKVTSEGKKAKKPFWKRHFLKLFLLLLLIISIAWGYFGKINAVSDCKEQLEQLKSNRETELTQLKQENTRKLASTLALSIRQAMIDENKSQVELYLNQSLKTFEVQKFMLVNQMDGKVIMSTNKKDEDEIFKSEKLVKAQDAIIEKYEDHTYAATPIMGLNTQLAVLIIQLD